MLSHSIPALAKAVACHIDARTSTRYRLVTRLRRPAISVLLFIAIAITAYVPRGAEAADVQLIGNVTYSYLNNTAVLTVAQVANVDSAGVSGTLRLELWALPLPYTGAATSGYKLAEYTLGQLSAGSSFANVSSGSIAFSPPANGTWIFTLFLTEYTAATGDDGYSIDDYRDFLTPVVFGPPPPPITPQVGVWWNPLESGSGYAIDFKSGVLVSEIYSYQANGAPQWYLVAGSLVGNTFTATLDKYTGGQCISCAYLGRPILVGNDGIVTIVFSSSTTATMYLPGGRVTQIQHFF